MLKYYNLENIDLYNEIENIDLEKNTIQLKFHQDKKEDLFLLGMLFAAGKSISAYNIFTRDFDEKKSFNKMSYFWSIFDESPSFNVINDNKKGFLICPVRNANKEDKEKLNIIINSLENLGYSIYYPARDTNQSDTIGYQICMQNASAMAEANNVFIYYDENSKGSMFDLGVAYYFQVKYPDRNFYLINSSSLPTFKNDFGKQTIIKMCDMSFNKSNDLKLERINK